MRGHLSVKETKKVLWNEKVPVTNSYEYLVIVYFTRLSPTKSLAEKKRN